MIECLSSPKIWQILEKKKAKIKKFRGYYYSVGKNMCQGKKKKVHIKKKEIHVSKDVFFVI